MLLVNILHTFAIIIDIGRWANKHAVRLSSSGEQK